ncbi:MAG TPA: DUF6785 family protein [Tepidisphaeraceae bacterium]|jgi:hypothetical protein
MTTLEELPVRQAIGQRSAMSFRSIALGFLFGLFICIITPFNDYAWANTAFVGNNLPLGLIMLTFLFALLVNGPLSKFAPRFAFTTGEMMVTFSIALVMCALPSSGLMRYLPPSIISPLYLSRDNPGYRETVLKLFHPTDGSRPLPYWLFPAFKSNDVQQWMNDPITVGYIERWTEDRPITEAYRAWIRPAFTWCIFIFAFYGAVLSMVSMLRKQWNENERLPFPLAQIEMALIQQPPPRRWFNGILSSKSFWVAFAFVFFIRTWNGLALYVPKHFEAIPVKYDFTNLLADAPFAYVDAQFKASSIYFIVIGVTFFLTSPVAFSLWVFYVMEQIYRMVTGATTGEPIGVSWDQHAGAVVAFALSVIWIGRHHWKLIIAQAFRGAREEEDPGSYLSHRTAFWAFVASMGVMMGWLWQAGCTPMGAIVLVLLLMMLVLVITRIIAETGLVYGQLIVLMFRPWQLLTSYGVKWPVTSQTFYMSGIVHSNFFDFREPISVYASHSLKLADQSLVDIEETPRRARSSMRKFIMLLALALVVAYFVSFFSTLVMEYHYSSSADIAQKTPVNDWGCGGPPQWYLLVPLRQYNSQNIPLGSSTPILHMSEGFLITLFLSFMRLRFSWWPFHPVGYLMVVTTPATLMWFSIMIGWLCKVLIVRFGGGTMYQNAKPFFIGMIVGDTMAAAMWLMVNIALLYLNVPYKAINFMPG